MSTLRNHLAATPTGRRSFIGASALTLSAGAVALLGGASGAARAATMDPAKDTGILNVALTLEHEAINAYQLGAGSGLLQKPVLDLALQFQGHHKGHRDALAATIQKLGGKPVAELKPEDYARALNAQSLKNQADVLALVEHANEQEPLFYVFRLLAYGLILAAIWQKNRGRR